MKVVALTAFLAGIAAPAQAAPLLLGQTVQVTYLYSTITSVYSGPVNVVVGAGVELTNFPNVNEPLHVDISDTNILLDHDFTSSWNPAPFNGFRFFDINGTIPTFTSVTIAGTNMVGFDQSRISFDANTIWVNWQGLSFNSETFVNLNVNGEAVPEPATFALLGLGLAAFGARRWQLSRR